MQRSLSLSVLTLLLMSMESSARQAPTTGSIEGIVVRVDSGAAIGGAQVALARIRYPAAASEALSGPLFRIEPEPPQRTTAGPDGKFSFSNIAPGSYRVSASAPGFARTELGQRVVDGIGRVVSITAGLNIKDAPLRMTPTGTVTGRILDENSQPATGAPVQLLRRGYSAQGVVFHDVVGTGTADDRGEYRIYDVRPGRYYLVAGTAPGPASTDRFSIVYYPAADSVEQAAAFEVKAGTTVALDMRVRRQPRTFRVTGRIANTTGLPLPSSPNIVLAHDTFTGGGIFSVSRNFDPATGVFELQDVPPGDYDVRLQIPETNAAQIPRARDPFARAAIRVVDRDIEGVVLTLSNDVTANGRLIVEGPPLPALTANQSPRLTFSSGLPNRVQPTGTFVAADGTFQVIGLRDGEYRVNVTGADVLANAGYYVKSIHYGGDEISSKLFKFSGAGSGVFELRIASGVGKVSGMLTDAAAQPLPGVQVYLIPSDRESMPRFRTATTDETGRFTVPNVVPGDYKAFSWEALENNAFFDRAVMQQYEAQGKPVRVTASFTSTVDLRLILAP
jgi:5-hydroxyisourate hydrolase-like protein (transthyretin family)